MLSFIFLHLVCLSSLNKLDHYNKKIINNIDHFRPISNSTLLAVGSSEINYGSTMSIIFPSLDHTAIRPDIIRSRNVSTQLTDWRKLSFTRTSRRKIRSEPKNKRTYFWTYLQVLVQKIQLCPERATSLTVNFVILVGLCSW